MNKDKRFLIALLTLASAPLLLLLWFLFIEVRFSNYSMETVFYQGCSKVWAHRGYVEKGLERNSLESVGKAFDEGAAGVEVDVFYDVGLNDFVVSHNRPYKKSHGAILLLEKIFLKFSQRGYFWLDLKNLSELTPAQVDLAVKRLAEIANLEKTIVESPAAEALARFSEKGMHTSYWLMPGENHNNPIVFRLMMTNYKANLLEYDFSAVSMSYLDIGEKVIDEFGHLPWHLFIVNEESDLKKYSAMQNVKVILSDSNRYDYACRKEGNLE